MQSARTFGIVALVVAAGVVAATLFWPRSEGVVVYCSADVDHAQPILDAFTRETGIAVREVKYETEASKTVGNVSRLRIERENPRADVFWNNEPLHTMRLAEEGMFEPYRSPAANDVPANFKDPKDRWTGFAARGRILIVNTQIVKPEEMPKSMDDFLDPKWRGRCGIARPLAGTTLTHLAVLYTALGGERTRAWSKALHENGVVFPSGNGPVASSVAAGQLAFGFTDTDDFRKVEAEGKPVARVFPDQEPGRPGTLVLPNTVALIRGGPNPDLGRKLIDYLLRKETEATLAASDGAHIPLRAAVARPAHVKGPPEFRAMEVAWDDVAQHFDERMRELESLWQ